MHRGPHRVGQFATDLIQKPATGMQCYGQRNQGNECQKSENDSGQLPVRRAQIVDINAGADHPVPWLESLDVGQFRIQLAGDAILGGFGPFVSNEPLAVPGNDPDEGLEEVGFVQRLAETAVYRIAFIR